MQNPSRFEMYDENLIGAIPSSGDPASNALLQHLSTAASMLDEHTSQASLYTINCFDWPLVCDMQSVATYPVLHLYPYGRRNLTYHGPINYYDILRTILL